MDTAARTELRQINESNFARFDAKLEQRAAEILAKVETKFAEMDTRFAELRAEMDRRFAELRAGLSTELRAEIAASKESMAPVDRRAVVHADARLCGILAE